MTRSEIKTLRTTIATLLQKLHDLEGDTEYDQWLAAEAERVLNREEGKLTPIRTYEVPLIATKPAVIGA